MKNCSFTYQETERKVSTKLASVTNLKQQDCLNLCSGLQFSVLKYHMKTWYLGFLIGIFLIISSPILSFLPYFSYRT